MEMMEVFVCEVNGEKMGWKEKKEKEENRREEKKPNEGRKEKKRREEVTQSQDSRERGTRGAGEIDDFTMSEITPTVTCWQRMPGTCHYIHFMLKSTVPQMRLHPAYYSIASKFNAVQSRQFIHAISLTWYLHHYFYMVLHIKPRSSSHSRCEAVLPALSTSETPRWHHPTAPLHRIR